MECPLPAFWQTDLKIRDDVMFAIAILGLDVQCVSLSAEFMPRDFVDWINVSKDDMLDEIDALDEGDFLRYLSGLASIVHTAVWGLECQNDAYKIKTSRRLHDCLAAFAERIILSSEQTSKPKSKQFFNSMLMLVHYFMSVTGLKWIKASKFRQHTVLYRRLLHASKVPDNVDLDRVKGEMGKWMLYLWWSPTSSYTYCGKTNRFLQQRTNEHVKCLHFPGNTRKKQLQPFYRIARRLGASVFFPLPIFRIDSSCETEIRMVESQLITYFHCKMNMPFARKYESSHCSDGYESAMVSGTVCMKRKKFVKKQRDDLVYGAPTVVLQDSAQQGNWDQKKLAIKLTQKRRRGENAVKFIAISDDKKCGKLVRFIYNFAQRSDEKKVALERLSKLCGDDMSVRIAFKLPVLPACQHLRSWYTQELSRQLAARIRKGRAVVIFDASMKQKSILRSMKNLSGWNKIINKQVLPCTCRTLRQVLDLPASMEFVDHVCVRNVQTSMVQTVPHQFNVQSNVIPSIGELKNCIRKEVQRINVKLKNQLIKVVDCKPFLDVLDSFYDANNFFKNDGVRAQDVSSWTSFLANSAVVCEIDKCKPQLCISCPRGFQLRVVSLLESSPGFSKFGPSLDEILEKIKIAKEQFSYTGVHMFKKHVVGHFAAWPKHSGLETKMRPTGSYARHALRKLLSLGCRSLCYVAELLAGKVDHGRVSRRDKHVCIPVKSFSEVVSNFNRKKIDWSHRRECGYKMQLFRKKIDLDNFFGRVPRSLVRKAICWMEATFVQKFGKRRMVIGIPKPSTRRTAETGRMKAFTRCYSLNLRNQRQKDVHPRLQPSKCNSDIYDVMHLLDLRILIELEFSNACLWFGDELVFFDEGVTQGSNLAMGIAQLCGGYMEFSISTCIIGSAKFNVDFLLQRWVDDIFIVLSIFFVNDADTQEAVSFASALADRIAGVYRQHFHLKGESSDEFVGMNVFDFNNDLHLVPVSYVNLGSDDFGLSRYRFKHYFSNSLANKKSSVVLSQIYSCVDRCSSEDFLCQALVRLFVEFRAVGYPIKILSVAMETFLAKYPFLTIVRQSWHFFLHREALFWRTSGKFRS